MPLFIIVPIIALIVLLLIFTFLGSFFRRVSPNKALIKYGIGTGQGHVYKGGAIVWPLIQSAKEISLELMSFDVAPEKDLYTAQGVAVNVEAVAQIKVESDPQSILRAAEQFLSKTEDEREQLIKLVLEGHLRGVIGQLTVEDIVKKPDIVVGKMQETSSADLDKMGLELISFTIKDVRDKNQYIDNMGKPNVAAIKRDAQIKEAEATRDVLIREAETQKEALVKQTENQKLAAIAKAEAEQETVVAQTLAEAKKAEAMRNLEVQKAQYQADIKRQQAVAEKAYEIEQMVQQQKVIAEQIKIQQVQKQEEAKVQELEVLRRQQELLATVVRPAEAEKQKRILQAEAEQQEIELLAGANNKKVVITADAEAQATKLRGEAEAQVILAKGQAEAQAMRLRAEAYQDYNQAAILDKLLSAFPGMLSGLAASLSKVDRITVVSNGGGDGIGLHKLTGEFSTILSQVPAIFETLSGVRMAELLKSLPAISQK
jgi:flotillin